MQNSRAQAIGEYFHNNLGMIADQGTRAFRKNVIEYAVNEQDYKVPSAAATYNTLVLKAIDEGVLRKPERGVLEMVPKTGRKQTVAQAKSKSQNAGGRRATDKGVKAKAKGNDEAANATA